MYLDDEPGEYTLEQVEDGVTLDLTNNLRRKLIWDSTPCELVDEVIVARGLLPASEEGHEVEHRASHWRLDRLDEIAAPVSLVSGLAGEVIGKGMLDLLEADESDEEYDELLERFQKMIVHGSHVVIAQLLDMKFLEIGKKGSLVQ